jgi:hypothetical protein
VGLLGAERGTQSRPDLGLLERDVLPGGRGEYGDQAVELGVRGRELVQLIESPSDRAGN